MNKKIITYLITTFCILNTDVSASQRRSRANSTTRNATIRKTTTINTTSLPLTIDTTNLNIINTNPNTYNQNEIQCGTPAPIDNLIAKRLCATAYSTALGKYCSETECKSAISVAMTMNFGIPLLKDISIDINGTKCSADGLNSFCSNFAEELVEGLWPMYSSQAIRERKNCNFAKAKFVSAQNCFNYILSEKNNTGLNNFFDSSKITTMDKKIDELCGRDAIIKNYNMISIDEWTTKDDETFFNSMSNVVSGKNLGSNKKLSSSIATQFANIGNANWDITGKVGNFLDGTWDLKTSSYPREITTLVNTFITEGETACGNDFKTEMQNTNFALENKQSSLEKEIAKKGLLKGLFDYSLNQASVVIGEELAQDIKDKGIYGKIKESMEKTPTKQNYTYTISYITKPSTWDNNSINTIKKLFVNQDISQLTSETAINYDNIKEIIEIIQNFK